MLAIPRSLPINRCAIAGLQTAWTASSPLLLSSEASGSRAVFSSPLGPSAQPHKPAHKRPTLTARAGGVDRLLSVREVAERLGVHPSTIYGLSECGELHHAWVSNAIRIALADLEAYLARRRAAE